jgi:type I restriction enzyme R subunit
MSRYGMTESEIEDAALFYLETLGYTVCYGPDIAPDAPNAERTSFGDVVLRDRLRDALQRINPGVPADAIDEALRQLLRSESQNLIDNNRRFHKLLTEGIPVSYQRNNRRVDDLVWPIDFDHPQRNDWLAVNQFTVVERQKRRPDIVLFLNGLPIAVIELKNAADENADIEKAFTQLQNYKDEIPSLFTYNQALVVSDGLTARIGTLTADHPRFMPWRDPPESANNVIPLTPAVSPRPPKPGAPTPPAPLPSWRC